MPKKLGEFLKEQGMSTPSKMPLPKKPMQLEVNAANNILDEDALYGLDDLERLMSEIGNMRENLWLMPDFQRREMAAKLAMKMAAMFGDSGDEDGL